MRGVVMSVKGRYAVLLNKDGEFVKVRNKNYTVGSTVSVTSNTGRICALAASFLVVCGGIGSYFTPVGYVSVDINPSFLLTLNVYNKVIDIDALNDDAVILLENTDVKGKKAEDSVDMLIKSSEEIGYLNENNKDVIVEVVSGIRNVKIREYSDVEVVVEKAEKSDLRNAKEMGVSIARAKAIKDYTTQNGGTVKDNAEKLLDKSVKEIRKGLETVTDELPVITPAPTEKVKEVKAAKNSLKKKDKNSILSFIGGKKEERAEEKTEVKPTIPATEIFRTPAPYFTPEKEQDKKEETRVETKEENTSSFPNYFMPQLQEKNVENDKEDKKTSTPQRENENREDNKENASEKEENTPVKDTDNSKSENQNTSNAEKQENNTADRQETPVKTQQTDRNQNGDSSEDNNSERNGSPKSENNRSETPNHNSGSGNESSNKTPSAPSAPSHSEGGSDNSPRGGADSGNGGNFGGGFSGER